MAAAPPYCPVPLSVRLCLPCTALRADGHGLGCEQPGLSIRFTAGAHPSSVVHCIVVYCNRGALTWPSWQLGCWSSDWCSGVPLGPRQTCWPLHVERSRATVCAQGPPKKGRGLDARKAAAAGLQSRIKGREESTEGWTQVSTSEELPEEKNKAIIHNNQGYVLVKRDTALFCIEANCTSCRFPMIEGKVCESENGAVGLVCPLCHTTFGLADGEVLEYCPKDGILQWVVGTLKEKAPKQNAKVFPARISNSGRVYVKFV